VRNVECRMSGTNALQNWCRALGVVYCIGRRALGVVYWASWLCILTSIEQITSNSVAFNII
jgi:hypothetical protein